MYMHVQGMRFLGPLEVTAADRTGQAVALSGKEEVSDRLSFHLTHVTATRIPPPVACPPSPSPLPPPPVRREVGRRAGGRAKGAIWRVE